ncbi:transferrin [Cephus cinctus]|uniref:Transferrin n=1 Tax=Cephus cinctus TaxID=211228 RepID=A0AAJ7C129_CEPCN|nr:transferrin [Cephus cinctus]
MKEMFTWFIVVSASLLFSVSAQESIHTAKLKLCVVADSRTAKRIHRTCPKLVTPGSQVVCVIANDRSECLTQLTTASSDFTVLEPEDLVAASGYTEYNILVTNELRLFKTENQRYEIVALVNKNVGSLFDLRGKRFCHPGYETSDDWTQIFATYFEKRVILNECDTNKTLVENRMHTLSNYFEAACIAGAWTPDSVLDTQLKSKYKNLCALCENPAGCYAADKYHGREGAVLCLTDSMGDVAWVRLQDALQHFKSLGIKKRDYAFLCPDGTVKPMDSNSPCVWIRRPWPVVASRVEVAERVSNIMRYLDQASASSWQNAVLRLLESYRSTPVPTDTLQTSEDFLSRFPGFMSANKRTGCQPSRRIQWCVASNLEDRKCRWIRQISFVYGIEQPISCYQVTSRRDCLEAVKTGQSDIFVAKPEEELECRKKGLKPILWVTTNKQEDMNKILAVVREDSKFRKLKDLKGGKACFSGYRSIGWNAFVSIMGNKSLNDWACSDAEAVSNFFSDSCVPDLSKDNETMPANLHSLCKSDSRVGDEASTFQCLTSGAGDVAFMSSKMFQKLTSNSSKYNKKGFRSLCEDGSHFNENFCFLTWTTLGSVMVNEEISNLRRDDIYSTLLELDLMFGQTFIRAFSMYGTYDGNRSIIFPEETQHLQRDVSHIENEKSYGDIVQNLMQAQCSGTSYLNIQYYNAKTIMLLLITFTLSHLMI